MEILEVVLLTPLLVLEDFCLVSKYTRTTTVPALFTLEVQWTLLLVGSCPECESTAPPIPQMKQLPLL